jgi:hypothetical protein
MGLWQSVQMFDTALEMEFPRLVEGSFRPKRSTEKAMRK